MDVRRVIIALGEISGRFHHVARLSDLQYQRHSITHVPFWSEKF